MAKGRFRAKARRSYTAARAFRSKVKAARRGRRGKGANFREMGAGALSNVAVRVASKHLGAQWGPPAGLAATGYFMGSDTAMFLAGMSLGNNVPLGNFGNAPGGWSIGA